MMTHALSLIGRRCSWAAASTILGLLSLNIGCAPRPLSLTVPLELEPTTDALAHLPGPSRSVSFPVIKDQRGTPDRIGENREEPRVVPIYAGMPGAVQWLHDAMFTQLRRCGVDVVNESTADRQLNVTVTEFWAEEAPNYSARVYVTVEVLDKSGKTLWSGTVQGQDSTFGHSLSEEDYQQVLSNSVVNLVNQMVTNPAFVQAVAANP